MRVAFINVARPFLLSSSSRLCFNPIYPTTTVVACKTNYRFPAKTLPYRASAMTTALRQHVQLKENIDLTNIEKQIIERLLNTITHFRLETVLRIAGGWVRDKLLGRDCYDIDIAVDNMLGSEFVDKVREYLLTTGEEAEGVAVIPSNPDQSKHLETARMRLCGMWVDFVNLRCEDYCENSRIPTMKFGTAEQDAYRRDLTINSLFYNINDGSVEDLTGRGISDLKSGKIVTPLPPKTTFLDDPLRVVRAIRFGARFEFTLDEELKIAAACDEVKAALAAKISRERIGTEIDLMISGNQPVKAMDYICDLTLFWVIFTLPAGFEAAVSAECHRLCIAYLDATWNFIQSIDSCAFNDEQRRLSLYAALFLPLRETTYMDKKGKKIPVVNYIFRDSLKRKVSDAETVVNIHRSLEKFMSLIPSLLSKEDMDLADDVCLTELADDVCLTELADVPIKSKLRVLTGFLLREIKEFWRVALLISLLIYPSDVDCTQDYLNKQFHLEKKMDLFKAIENHIIELGLDKVWNEKPLVGGKDIMSVLQLKTGGPLVREWQQKLLAWQLAHPSGTADECLDWMRETNSKRARFE